MLTPSTLPQLGEQVIYQGETYTVRAVDGNVLELAYHTGGFFRLVHVSNVTACPSPATQTAASLPAPAAGQGEGTILDFGAWLTVERETALALLRAPSPRTESLAVEVERCRPFVARIKECEAAIALIAEWHA